MGREQSLAILICVFFFVMLVAMVSSKRDMSLDTDGDGLRDHVDDFDDDNDGLPDHVDEDDDGDGIMDHQDEDWFEHDEV